MLILPQPIYINFLPGYNFQKILIPIINDSSRLVDKHINVRVLFQLAQVLICLLKVFAGELPIVHSNQVLHEKECLQDIAL